MSSTYRILTKYDFVVQVLQDILKQGPKQNTTVIICSTKEDFVSQLIDCIDKSRDPESTETSHLPGRAENTAEIPASQEDLEDDYNNVQNEYQSSNDMQQPSGARLRNHLLTPTLHMLSTSQNVNLIFCPTIAVFRAFISVYIAPTSHQPSSPPSTTAEAEAEVGTGAEAAARPPSTTPTKTNQNQSPKENLPKSLFVINLLHLHKDTSEFTLQGLSRSFASLVSAAYRNNTSTLDLIECRDVNDPTHPDRGNSLWDAQVPLLSGSVKISAAARASWGGARRTVTVRKIAERWFRFV